MIPLAISFTDIRADRRREMKVAKRTCANSDSLPHFSHAYQHLIQEG